MRTCGTQSKGVVFFVKQPSQRSWRTARSGSAKPSSGTFEAAGLGCDCSSGKLTLALLPWYQGLRQVWVGTGTTFGPFFLVLLVSNFFGANIR